jgi:hypothetical protein
MVFRVVRSFRVQAVNASFSGLPASSNPEYTQPSRSVTSNAALTIDCARRVARQMATYEE